MNQILMLMRQGVLSFPDDEFFLNSKVSKLLSRGVDSVLLDEDHLKASFRLTFLSRLIYKPPLIASNKISATHFGERSIFEEILRGLSHFDVF